ncbi:MAG: biotin-dependent carboxyltransferase family protein [Gemmatimonadaceae bacterium]|nr:biotin-dependent carboxyltransferase family protein [Gemmatimonadaceae bacterium]
MSITITRAPSYLTIQDFGRTQFREVGVPRCGAMDRAALGTANAVLGNEADAAGLEWALGGGTLRFDHPCVFAVGGASVDVALNSRPVDVALKSTPVDVALRSTPVDVVLKSTPVDVALKSTPVDVAINATPVEPFTTMHAKAGDVLKISGFTSGRFLYIAFGGGLDTEELLGSRSTYRPAHFGGIEGRMIRTGESVRVSAHNRGRAGFSAPDDLRPDYSRRSIRVVPGPQWSFFTAEDRALFFGQSYTVSRASDRMGYRLEGKPLSASLGLLPSEGVCEGAIQVPPDGLPIVLMADSPTVGGYPKIGVVASTDLPVLAQLSPGECFQFEECSVQDAQRRARRAAGSLHTIRSLASR